MDKPAGSIQAGWLPDAGCSVFPFGCPPLSPADIPSAMPSFRFHLPLALLAAAVYGGVWFLINRSEHAARLEGASLTQPATAENLNRPLPIADIARSLRAMKLVTVEIQTSVRSRKLDESWRGDVAASVTAPARLLYGCDLSGVGDDSGSDRAASLRPNILTGGYTLRVPRPTRIAAEIAGDQERHDVSVGWGRFRDLGGEYQLGLARAALYEQARLLQLSDQQRAEVEKTTREQLTALVRGFAAAGDPVAVNIEFFDQPVENGGENGLADAPTDLAPGAHR